MIARVHPSILQGRKIFISPETESLQQISYPLTEKGAVIIVTQINTLANHFNSTMSLFQKIAGHGTFSNTPDLIISDWKEWGSSLSSDLLEMRNANYPNTPILFIIKDGIESEHLENNRNYKPKQDLVRYRPIDIVQAATQAIQRTLDTAKIHARVI